MNEEEVRIGLCELSELLLPPIYPYNKRICAWLHLLLKLLPSTLLSCMCVLGFIIYFMNCKMKCYICVYLIQVQFEVNWWSVSQNMHTWQCWKMVIILMDDGISKYMCWLLAEDKGNTGMLSIICCCCSWLMYIVCV